VYDISILSRQYAAGGHRRGRAQEEEEKEKRDVGDAGGGKLCYRIAGIPSPPAFAHATNTYTHTFSHVDRNK
jgi:hypothetical protein